MHISQAQEDIAFDAERAAVQSMEEEDTFDEADEVLPFTYSITYYGADFPVDSLIKRLKSKDINVPTFGHTLQTDPTIAGFQRDFVWPKTKADRFIESLLLGLPVPGIFLVRESTGRLLVLDGHQRLHTLQTYYDGSFNGREYRLQHVQERFKNKRFIDLDAEDRRRLDDSIIHATIVRQDEPTDDYSSIYSIFERLNTGGVNLQPQEIRVALYHGELVQLLARLNEEEAWRSLYGPQNKRLRDMEMILRFFAFYYYASDYRPPMKDFLNRYIALNRNLSRQTESELSELFRKTTSTLNSSLGSDAFRPERVVNAAVVDSLMTGTAKRLDRSALTNRGQLRDRYESLLLNEEYNAAISTHTSSRANVEIRMRLSTEAFANIE